MLDVSYYSASPSDQDINFNMTWAALYTDRSIGGEGRGGGVWGINRVKKIRGGDREGSRLGEEWWEANVGERQRLVSGSERGKQGECRQVWQRRNQRREKERGKQSFVPFQSTTRTPLWYHLDISHLSSFIFLWSPPVLLFYFYSHICSSVFPLFLSTKSFPRLLASSSVAPRVSCDINNSANVARLLIVAVLVLFAHLLSPLYLSLSPSPLWFPVHTTPYAAVSQCIVLQGHRCREMMFKAKTKWLTVSGPGC